MSSALQVGGLTRCTTIDFPGELAAVVYCQGCPWHCHYCHNAALIPEQGQQQLDWQQVVAFIQQRRGLLDGIVFSGGEPTAQTALIDAMHTVKELGMKVALHTNGAYSDRLRALLPLCDWVGMDLKAPFDDYETITKCPASGEQARQSAELLRASGVAHQFRTTVDPWLREEGRLEQMQALVESWGETLVLQTMRS
ncbi:anaerobic ribonucleoside-triphosphate reductase activating protein [Desulfuromonas acetoxidans]|uniref:Ribonucleoside-triphosphate reductase, anaerobic-like n=1 Tax=Desulfuromonas acetoxidans (strain DSM 684 / 11070) TaxID=281689 RepID=Q1JWT3_DESA6|nr:anaerobic ribonucleoside-triphosphate reductase activating protein [Desulfuromonas acetoxidans]EAT14711.1 Ribonucleoside-triphosphate reductase, anaerobic-like [Desulfuromonas acetoxidans DSM 684]MBF0646291.1 anaerobic ribonucleoside-triphosphate reductase activating protein [Desulfuromonas acetoxidans]NVD26231.1 anaerobic ribonucleoside-triphosphate reductase activating protein [Desulfuromonas acetoxidans]NVE17280.1 anaerobic ribonucleoside-triphosphate reductase activating protein [Desulfu